MEFIAFPLAALAFIFTIDLISKNKKLTERIEVLEEKMGLKKSNNSEE